MDAKDIIASMSASENIKWGTNAPFSFGRVWIDRIGFASTPVVGCTVYRTDHITAVVRQHVYRELHRRGLPFRSDVIDIRPLVGDRTRKRVVVDDNPHSESFGKRKRMVESEYTFEILDINTFCQAYGKFPFGRTFLGDVK